MFGRTSAKTVNTKPELLVGLDLGTSKISVIVAEKEPQYDEFQIIAVSSVPSHGIRKGNIVHIDQAADSVREAISAAQAMIGDTIRDVTVAFSCGDDMRCSISTGHINLGTAAKTIMTSDIMRVIEAAQQDVAIPSSKTILHTIPIEYILDGNEGIVNPEQLTGKDLTVTLCSVMVSTSILQNIISCVSKAGLNVKGMILKPFAAALGVLTGIESSGGTVIIDMGGGTTSVTVLNDGCPIYMGMIPVGGEHVTNDLSTVLRISPVNAEEIKKQVSICDEDNISETINFTYNGRDFAVSSADVAEIIRCRFEELCNEQIMPNIQKSKITSLTNGVVLTGGVSKTTGLDVFMLDSLKVPVRLAVPTLSTSMPLGKNGAEFSALAGILKYIAAKQRCSYSYIENFPGKDDEEKEKESKNGLFSALFANRESSKTEKKSISIKESQQKIKEKLEGPMAEVKELFRDLF